MKKFERIETSQFHSVLLSTNLFYRKSIKNVPFQLSGSFPRESVSMNCSSMSPVKLMMVNPFLSAVRFSITNSQITSPCLRTKTGSVFAKVSHGVNLFLFFSISSVAFRKRCFPCPEDVTIRALFSLESKYVGISSSFSFVSEVITSTTLAIILGLIVWHWRSFSSSAVHCSMNLAAKSCPHATWQIYVITNKQRTRFTFIAF